MFEEIDYQTTAIGDISLRRRNEPRVNNELVYEVKLNDDFLMSSLVTAGEIALAELALAVTDADALNIVVGGLGLGYTAQAALADPRVSSLLVIDALEPVIDWHRRGLVPLGKTLSDDRRCHFLCADFFALALSEQGFEPAKSGEVDAILLDIDHSPQHRLTERHDNFYAEASLRTLSHHLSPNGVFAMWSNDPPDDAFMQELAKVFSTVDARISEFANPYSGGTSRNTIYLAHQ